MIDGLKEKKVTIYPLLHYQWPMWKISQKIWKCLTIVTNMQRQLMQKDGLFLNINQIDATM